MLRETTDAARWEDVSHLCWQKVWRMRTDWNHTDEFMYPNMQSTIAYRTFRSSSEFAPGLPVRDGGLYVLLRKLDSMVPVRKHTPQSLPA